jgi:putative polyhydroxyalkanoic acid system protein
MKIEVPHELDLAEATARIKSLVAYWREKYAVEPRWKRRTVRLSGRFLGAPVEATLAVGATAVVFEGPDPGVLLRTQAAAYVTRKIGSYLGAEPPAARARRATAQR